MSDEVLHLLIGIKKKYSRNDLTVFICNYIKEKKLQNPNDRRKFYPIKN